MKTNLNRVGIVGTTSWGTTLAIVMARKGLSVTLLARSQEESDRLNFDRENKKLLPGFSFPKHLVVTTNGNEALLESHFTVIAVPSKTFRSNIREIRTNLNPSTVIISATKGLELDSGFRMSEVIEQELDPPLNARICILSGPNLSTEIADGVPALTVLASNDTALANAAQSALMTDNFRIYTNADVIGVELAGALKNIVAIGAGICDGLGYGNNAKAAFVTRGLAEITKIGIQAGANPMTFAGLAGFGDLMATASSSLSRNRYLGEELGKGKTLDEIRESMHNVTEGVDSTSAALMMADRYNVDIPITKTIYRILFEGLDPSSAAKELLARAPQPELNTGL